MSTPDSNQDGASLGVEPVRVCVCDSCSIAPKRESMRMFVALSANACISPVAVGRCGSFIENVEPPDLHKRKRHVEQH